VFEAVVVQDPEIVKALRVARRKPDRSVTGGERLVVAPQTAVDFANIAMIERRLGGRGDRPLHQRRRLLDPTLPEADDAEKMERARVLGRQSKGVSERLLGLVQPPGLLVPPGEADEFGQAIGASGWRRRLNRRFGLRVRSICTGRAEAPHPDRQR
jgi:hypothetical protein